MERPNERIMTVIGVMVLVILVTTGLLFFVSFLNIGPSIRNIITPAATGSCNISGCSGELCVDSKQGGLASICIYRNGFACYKKATCEKQPNGKCGWTSTPELLNCLKSNQD